MDRLLSSLRVTAFGIPALAFVAALLWWYAGVTQSRTEATPRAVAPRGPLGADELGHIDVFKRTSPSVMHITTLTS